MKTETEQKYNATLAARGFTIESSEPKAGETMLDYVVTIKKDGREVITTDYHMGIGHVNLKRAHFPSWQLSNDEACMLDAWISKPYANFKDKALQMRVAVKLAKQQKLTPDLADVLHSLVMDGQAYFQAQSFEDWVNEYGYDADSRKAEMIYRKCDEIGRQLARALGSDEIAKLETLLQDF